MIRKASSALWGAGTVAAVVAGLGACAGDGAGTAQPGPAPDASVSEAGGPDSQDAGVDATPEDAHADSGPDGPVDASPSDGEAGTPDAEPPGPVGCHAGELQVGSTGVGFVSSCDNSSLKLLPWVRIGDQWLGGGKHGACTTAASSVSCPVNDLGRVLAQVSGNTASVRFEASKATEVQSLLLEGEAVVPGATAWLSNGFQSFSQSGVLKLSAAPSDSSLFGEMQKTGEDEVYRRGDLFSYWFSYVGGGKLSLFAGATTSRRLQPWVQFNTVSGDTLRVRIASGGVGERVALQTGESVEGEVFRIQLGEDLEYILERNGNELETRRAKNLPHPEPGWNSWYAVWDKVTPADIEANSVALNALLGPRLPVGTPPMRVLIDDGWEVAWGQWEPNSKFAGQMSKIASDIKAKGLRPGIWIAPLLADVDSPVCKDHPDWFVRGKFAQHPGKGDACIVDVTNPDGVNFLKTSLQRLLSWGFDMLKIDFLYAGALQGERDEPITGLEAYHKAMQIIRETAGEDVSLLACGAPPLPSFPYVDSWRLGNDIAFSLLDANWAFIMHQARNFTSRWHYCLSTYCDADPPLLRRLPRDEVETGAWVAAATGGMLFLSDKLPELPPERVDWGMTDQRIRFALGGLPARPESHYPTSPPSRLLSMKDLQVLLFGTVLEVPAVWRMPDGTRIGFNFTGSAIEIDGVSIPRHASRELPVSNP